MVGNRQEQLVVLQIHMVGHYTSVLKKSVHVHEELVREAHRKVWLWVETLRMKN